MICIDMDKPKNCKQCRFLRYYNAGKGNSTQVIYCSAICKGYDPQKNKINAKTVRRKSISEKCPLIMYDEQADMFRPTSNRVLMNDVRKSVYSYVNVLSEKLNSKYVSVRVFACSELLRILKNRGGCYVERTRSEIDGTPTGECFVGQRNNAVNNIYADVKEL